MAKSTNGGRNGGSINGTTTEPKARRAPARRRTDKKVEAGDAVVTGLESSGKNPASEPTAMIAGVTGDHAAHAANLSHEAVRRRAYELYILRGCTDGCDVDDWLEAERQLRGQDRTH